MKFASVTVNTGVLTVLESPAMDKAKQVGIEMLKAVKRGESVPVPGFEFLQLSGVFEDGKYSLVVTHDGKPTLSMVGGKDFDPAVVALAFRNGWQVAPPKFPTAVKPPMADLPMSYDILWPGHMVLALAGLAGDEGCAEWTSGRTSGSFSAFICGIALEMCDGLYD